MATKLEKLEIHKVDLVDEGANPEANVLIYKNKDDASDETIAPEESTIHVDEDKLGVGIAKSVLSHLAKWFAPQKKENETVAVQKDCDTEVEKEAFDDMKIDRTKLSAEECEALDAILAKAGIEESVADTAKAVAEVPTGDEVTKGIHPEVAKELESLRKFREAAEDKELTEVAKKYEILGKKPEELVPMLKKMKSSGGTDYEDMISLLDANLAVVKQSGIFDEIGKRGSGVVSASASTVARVEEIAKGIMDKDGVNYQQAMVKAWENHPELLKEYEANI